MKMNGEKRLFLTLLVTMAILTAELVGGYLSNSLALLSDAGHMVTDALAIALGLVAARISRKPSDEHATYGYHRVGVLAALINGLSLLVIAVLIFYESYERLMAPPLINIPVMLGVAFLGLVGNIVMALILGMSHEDLNIKSVWLHVLGDTLSSVGVIVSGIVIYFTGWIYADPITGVLIGCIIILGGIRLVRDTLSIFLVLTPKGFSVEALTKKIAAIAEVKDVHDVHLWSIAHNHIAFSAHVLLSDRTLSEADITKKNIEHVLKENGIAHSSLQIECTTCGNNGLYCRIEPDEDEEGHHH
ncbi:MAG TPA: cation diffusion facilitator family transporter [Syntrophorhabdus sp.]|nr:cation diffusion facilitator family transporter [Syntrophorhabdus sp.]